MVVTDINDDSGTVAVEETMRTRMKILLFFKGLWQGVVNFETSQVADFIILGLIFAASIFVSFVMGKNDFNDGLGVFLTTLGLLVPMATRRIEGLTTVTYYFCILVGLYGLFLALF